MDIGYVASTLFLGRKADRQIGSCWARDRGGLTVHSMANDRGCALSRAEPSTILEKIGSCTSFSLRQ